MTWLVAFVVTVLLEASVYQLPLVDSTPTQSKHRRLVDCLLVMHAHPLVFLLLPLMIPTDATTYVLVAEHCNHWRGFFAPTLRLFETMAIESIGEPSELAPWLMASLWIGALGFLALDL